LYSLSAGIVELHRRSRIYNRSSPAGALPPGMLNA
jgi:hypothetical protein